MKTLILGGVRSGKSRLAEALAIKTNKPVTYIATASPDDVEMTKRIELHKQNRPEKWTIIEEPLNLASALKMAAKDDNCIIIDCLTLWITNLLLLDEKVSSEKVSNKKESIEELPDEKSPSDVSYLDKSRNDLLASLDDFKNDIFIVSNETGLGIMPLGELTRKFGDEAGITNQAVAACCDQVLMTIAGLPLVLKGKPL